MKTVTLSVLSKQRTLNSSRSSEQRGFKRGKPVSNINFYVNIINRNDIMVHDQTVFDTSRVTIIPVSRFNSSVPFLKRISSLPTFCSRTFGVLFLACDTHHDRRLDSVPTLLPSISLSPYTISNVYHFTVPCWHLCDFVLLVPTT